MKLRDSRLCVACEEIFEGVGACPSCGNLYSLPVSRYLKTFNHYEKELFPHTIEAVSRREGEHE